MTKHCSAKQVLRYYPFSGKLTHGKVSIEEPANTARVQEPDSTNFSYLRAGVHKGILSRTEFNSVLPRSPYGAQANATRPSFALAWDSVMAQVVSGLATFEIRGSALSLTVRFPKEASELNWLKFLSLGTKKDRLNQHTLPVALL